MKKIVYKTNVEYVQVLDEKAKLDQRLFRKTGLKDKDLLNIYRYMVITRVFDRRALNLQRQGRMLTYAPCEGEEAISVASAYALKKKDWVVPAYREQGVYVTLGVPLRYVFMYFMGFEEGNRLPPEFNITPFSIPVATHFPHAAGIGLAMNYLGEKSAVLTFTGDGGTSEGDFYEALNWAGVFKAPVVFVVRNNQWAISVPREKQTAAQTLAQKAVAAGVRGVQVDGNDPLGVYLVVKEALERARKGEGPTLVEALTYRLGLHTTADDPTRYRSKEEVEKARKREPFIRYTQFLKRKGILTDRKMDRIWREAQELVDGEAEEAERFKTKPENMFRYVYGRMPPELEEQMKEMGV